MAEGILFPLEQQIPLARYRCARNDKGVGAFGVYGLGKSPSHFSQRRRGVGYQGGTKLGL